MPCRPAPLATRLAVRVLAITHLIATAHTVRADQYDPPATYYNSATGTGATLKQQLNDIIDGHDSNSYDNARFSLAHTDVDPNNSNNLLTVYDRTSINKSWSTSPLIWNREHTWPQSRGTDSGMGHSDLFNLRPALVSNNGDRGNLNYGGAFGSNSGQPGLVNDGGSFYYPGDIEAGVVARQAFYMDVRYDGSDFADLRLVAGNPAANQNQMGNLTRLLEYHYAAPPVVFERRRNQVIYSDGLASSDFDQENRNPFIDRPEFAWSVFVDQANDSSLALAGGVAGPAAGGTTLNLDLGRRLVNSALPAAQPVTLNKSGVDGTYYSVTAAGSATSSLSDRFNAFRIGAPGTQAITVGLAAGTSMTTAGLRNGTVTIDNLDITGGGGPGAGANDANDVINVSLSVLDHANASFAANDANSLTLDFGSITLGAAVSPLTFSLFNVASNATFTAGLDLDGITGSGATAAFSTDLAPFSGLNTLPASASRQFQASINTAVPGSYTASYTLNFSDENLVGATALAPLTLQLTGIVTTAAALNADFDGDGDIDGGDFVAWQRGLGLSGTATRADGDANGDQIVDAADLGVWRDQFGTAPSLASSATAAVPEPTAIHIAGGIFAALACTHGRRRTRTAIPH